MSRSEAQITIDTPVSGLIVSDEIFKDKGRESMDESQGTVQVTNEELARRMDMFGEQMNWLCENLAQLFQFVNAMGSNGGGIRGLMKAMKDTPELKEQIVE